MTPGRARTRAALAACFAVSGGASLSAEVVWLRLAYTSLGVTPAVTAGVVAVFMGGLALGAWAGGRVASTSAGPRALFAGYAVVEALIATAAFAVPPLVAWRPLDSVAWLAVALGPWTILMGVTFPLAQAALGRGGAGGDFGHLYAANVAGAFAGTVATAVAGIESLGLRGVLFTAAGCHLAAAGFALAMAIRRRAVRGAGAARRIPAPAGDAGRKALPAMFVAGATSLGMQIAWVWNFTPVLGNQVYSFAALLAVSLAAGWAGAERRRRDRLAGREPWSDGMLAAGAGLAGLVPLLLADPRSDPGPVRVLASLMPFGAVLGYLTPRLVDAASRGDPARAGSAYAVNALGCVAGPLVASGWLLPALGVRGALLALLLPWLALAIRAPRTAVAALGAGWIWVAAGGRTFDEAVAADRPPALVRRDAGGTVVACGAGFDRALYVNGMGLTRLTPATKEMAHLPMSCAARRDAGALVICLGMGTTFRSMTTWGVPVTAVELSRGVADLVGFFHPDLPGRLDGARRRIIVDDGRRFLARTPDRYAVITVDPPPPPEAAASSLLYSREFFALARDRLDRGGILHVWFPTGDPESRRAVARTLAGVFAHLRAFRGARGTGVHLLASEAPVRLPSADTAAARMPAAARADLMEWGDPGRVEAWIAGLHRSDIAMGELLKPADGPIVTDDRPFNEYWILRRWRAGDR